MNIKFKTLNILGAAIVGSFALTGCGGAVIASSSSEASSLSSISVSSSPSISSASKSSEPMPVSSSSSAVSSIPASSSSASSIAAGSTLVYAINAGATKVATLNGVQYQADRFSTGGMAGSTSDPIGGVAEDELYQTERYGTFNYEIPVSNASYSVVLHMAELYQTTAGKRTFNVSVEGKLEISNLDLYSQAGHVGAYEYIIENVAVTDGKLSIALNSVLSNATISGVAVYSNNGGKLVEPPDLKPIASGFNALFMDIPCDASTKAPLATGAVCLHPGTMNRYTKTVKVGGTAGVNYKITLRIRGIWEPTRIQGGQDPIAGKPFTIGGTIDSANADYGYQQYSINVASPKQTYWLNNYRKTGHDIYKADYEGIFTAAGGSDVTIIMNDGNERQISNFTKDFFSDVPPYNTAPSLGQSLRLDVIKVE